MLRCGDLKTLPSLEKLRVLTGQRGLDRAVRWFYTPEDDDFSAWVHGGELLIVSGALAHRPAFNLSRVLREAIRLHLAGVLLLFGSQYVADVPQSLIEMASARNFPILAIPWNVPLVDIQESIARAIVRADGGAAGRESLLERVLGGRVGAQEFRRQAQAEGYPVDAPQTLCLFRLLPKEGDGTAGAKLERLAGTAGKEMVDVLHERNVPAMMTTSFHQIYVLYATAEAENDETQGLPAALFACVTQQAPVGSVIAGAARSSALGDFMTLYHGARTAAEIARSLGKFDAPYIYEDGGLAELIVGSSLTEYFQRFAHGTLAPLRTADAGARSALVETLAAYLEHDGNVLRAAEALYLHRNTVKYRLHRIEEILGRPLAEPDVRLKLHLAIYIERLLG